MKLSNLLALVDTTTQTHMLVSIFWYSSAEVIVMILSYEENQ